MQVEMARSLPEGNGINPVAASHRLNKFGRLLNNASPFIRFIVQKVDRSSEMATRIEQTPTKQRGRMRMMTQQPTAIAPNLEAAKTFHTGVKRTNRTAL
jgi:hypothetical protein